MAHDGKVICRDTKGNTSKRTVAVSLSASPERRRASCAATSKSIAPHLFSATACYKHLFSQRTRSWSWPATRLYGQPGRQHPTKYWEEETPKRLGRPSTLQQYVSRHNRKGIIGTEATPKVRRRRKYGLNAWTEYAYDRARTTVWRPTSLAHPPQRVCLCRLRGCYHENDYDVTAGMEV